MAKDKLAEAYRAQEKAPKRGVKADDADEYKSKGSNYNKAVTKSLGAYKAQDKAPPTRGVRGKTQSDGGPIQGWDKSVDPHGAYKNQNHWKDMGTKPSKGFQLSGQEAGYLGHFNQDKFLLQGHNDGGFIDWLTGGDNSSDSNSTNTSPTPTPTPDPDSEDTLSARKSVSSSFKRATHNKD